MSFFQYNNIFLKASGFISHNVGGNEKTLNKELEKLRTFTIPFDSLKMIAGKDKFRVL